MSNEEFSDAGKGNFSFLIFREPILLIDHVIPYQLCVVNVSQIDDSPEKLQKFKCGMFMTSLFACNTICKDKIQSKPRLRDVSLVKC